VGLVQVAMLKEAAQERGVRPEDRDIDVPVRSRGMAHEEVDGVAPGYPPGEVGLVEQGPGRGEGKGGPGTGGVGLARQGRRSFPWWWSVRVGNSAK
jgi:hypothetical protein